LPEPDHRAVAERDLPDLTLVNKRVIRAAHVRNPPLAIAREQTAVVLGNVLERQRQGVFLGGPDVKRVAR
jgi:hypothetical protein